MAVDQKEVAHIAKLSDLDLSNGEIKKYSKDISAVVDLFKELEEVDTENTDPTSQTTGLQDALRADKIETSEILSQDQATANSDNVHNGYFVVDRLIQKTKDD